MYQEDGVVVIQQVVGEGGWRERGGWVMTLERKEIGCFGLGISRCNVCVGSVGVCSLVEQMTSLKGLRAKQR